MAPTGAQEMQMSVRFQFVQSSQSTSLGLKSSSPSLEALSSAELWAYFIEQAEPKVLHLHTSCLLNWFDTQENCPSGRRNLIWAHTLLMKCNPMRVAQEYWPVIGGNWSRDLNTVLWLVTWAQYSARSGINKLFSIQNMTCSARQALSALHNIWSDPTWQVLARNPILMRYYQRKNS